MNVIFPRNTIRAGACLGFLSGRGKKKRWGKCKTNIWHEGELWLSSRLSYHLNVAPIKCHIGRNAKEGLVCHTCDNGWCIEPTHLYEGTALRNNLDTIERHPNYHKKLKMAWKRRRTSKDYPQYQMRIIEWRTGSKHSETTKLKISKSHKGKSLSLAHRKAISRGLLMGGCH